MWQLKDAETRTIAENVYDTFNRVKEQRAYGDPDKTWTFHYSGFSTIEQNPLGGRTRYFFDDKHRNISRSNEMGERSHAVFDGQNRSVISLSPGGREIRSYYDPEHNLRAQVDAREGDVGGLTLDANFNLVSIDLAPGVEAQGTVTLYSYDTLHRLTSITVKDLAEDYPDRITGFHYDAGNDSNLPNKIIDPKGNETLFEYHPVGHTHAGELWKETEVSSTGNRTTKHEYDAPPNEPESDLETLKTVTYNDGSYETFAYSDRGDLRFQTNTRAIKTEFQYNKRRQLRKTIQPGPDGDIVTERKYDDSGNVEEDIDAEGNITRYTWSPQRKLLTETIAYGTAQAAKTEYMYDLRDWREYIIDPLLRETKIEYYATERVKKITDPLLRETDFTYDVDGNRTSVTTHGQTTTGFTYNEWGLQETMTDAAEKTVMYGFNGFGEQVSLTNRRDKIFKFTYDANGNPEEVTTPLLHTTKTIWNDRGLVGTIERPGITDITIKYDDRGRITERKDGLGEIDFEWALDRGMVDFDPNENEDFLTVTEGTAVLTRVFDDVGRVETYTDGRGNAIGYEWYDNGLLKKIIYPENDDDPNNDLRSVTYTYYLTNRLKTVTDWDNRKTTYHWNTAGELTGIDRPNGADRVNVHDAASQLRRIYERDPAGNLLAYFRFGYDDDGRLDWRYRLPKPQEVNLPPIDATYDDDNRIDTWAGTAVVHDDRGNMTAGPLFGHSFTSYGYDVRDRLISAGGVSYDYDAENSRTSMTTAEGATSFVVDPNSANLPRVLIRKNPDQSTTTYVYGIGLLYEVHEAEGIESVTYYHFDHIGSTAMLTNEAGEVTDRVEYSPWGDITYREGETDTPFLFVGEYGVQTDPNGLLHMRARYYSPELRRFLNADPIGFEGGLNWYAYANGNPIMYVDPSGLYPGEYIVDYWRDAIVSPANGTLGGSIVAGIEGAGQGAWAAADGIVPFFKPFQNTGYYDPSDPIMQLSQDYGMVVGVAGSFALGGAVMDRVLRLAPAGNPAPTMFEQVLSATIGPSALAKDFGKTAYYGVNVIQASSILNPIFEMGSRTSSSNAK